jgi:hypothetical protein
MREASFVQPSPSSYRPMKQSPAFDLDRHILQRNGDIGLKQTQEARR